LSAIGALALAFNEVEANLDRLFFEVTGLDEHLQLEVSTRIGGIDGKLAIIKRGAEKILDNAEFVQLSEMLGKGVFENVKIYRDCVIHARHLNVSTGVGVKVDRQDQVFDVLLSQNALDTAYILLAALRREIAEAIPLIHGMKLLKKIAADDPKRAPFESVTANHRAQFHQYRSERLALPLLPEFPSESELRAADFQAKQAQTAAVMDWFLSSPMPPPFPPRGAWIGGTDLVLPILPPEEKKT
jgi:hypothetical protein